jgi:hypothetical protein
MISPVSFLGVSRNRQAVHPPADAGELGGVTARDLEDREVRLGELWEDQPAVLVFLRHYG